jgi:hypothetical protein
VKQRVVSTGVYGFVRYPMYLGAIMIFAGAPCSSDYSPVCLWIFPELSSYGTNTGRRMVAYTGPERPPGIYGECAVPGYSFSLVKAFF